MSKLVTPLSFILLAAGLVGCSEPESFSLSFEATADGKVVDCGMEIGGLGPNEQHSVGLSDLRFYVSNIEFSDHDGKPVELTLDENEFQYRGANGWVGLIDLTGNSSGSCSTTAISYSEGTARTNAVITGTTLVQDVHSVSFDVGVPQALMKEVIGSSSPEAAPSPLNEMYWSWQTGYRHFVFNFTASDGTQEGEGYVHVGSTDCAAEGELALESQDTCAFVNTPRVELSEFGLVDNTVAVDIGALLKGIDFLAPVYDPESFEVIGEQVGAECHSSPMQPDCANVFANFGIEMSDGTARAAANGVFSTL